HELDLTAHRSFEVVGILQSVSPDPQFIVTLRQIRDEESPLIVGDNDLAERDLKRPGFRNHPHARLRSAAGVIDDYAADTVRTHLNPKISCVPLRGRRRLKQAYREHKSQ